MKYSIWRRPKYKAPGHDVPDVGQAEGGHSEGRPEADLGPADSFARLFKRRPTLWTDIKIFID